MEPCAAIGLASNIISFVDFASHLISTINEIHYSASGSADGDWTLREVTTSLQRLSVSIESELPTGNPDPASQSLRDLTTECSNVAADLLGLLAGLQAKDPSSKRQSAKAALKRVWKTRERSDLEHRLTHLSQALDLRFQDAFRSEVKEHLQRLLKEGRGNKSALEKLQLHVDAISSDVVATSLDNGAIRQLRENVFLTDEIILKIRQRQCLRGLWFDSIAERYGSVEIAHEGTFEWLFTAAGESKMNLPRDEAQNTLHLQNGKLTPKMLQASSNLVSWLEDDKPFLHVFGKPGSGKSTLMKFLRNHFSTGEHLKVWAGDNELIIASFFFWKSGTRLQRSLEGLLRSLLHSILAACPELISTVLPTQWEETEDMYHYAISTAVSGAQELERSFEYLMGASGAFENHRLAFFIDGLDEFEPGQISQRYGPLLQTLLRWSSMQNGKVKICVSSREYPVLEAAFCKSTQLRLQTITANDICRVVNSFLTTNEDFLHLLADDRSIEKLQKTILSKCDGVFLWVALVLRNLADGLANGDSMADLETTVLTLPTEIEELLAGLLDSIEPQYRKYCHKILGLVSRADGLFMLRLPRLFFVEMILTGISPDDVLSVPKPCPRLPTSEEYINGQSDVPMRAKMDNPQEDYQMRTKMDNPLEDYQMQLMLLEHQNRKRLRQVRDDAVHRNENTMPKSATVDVLPSGSRSDVEQLRRETNRYCETHGDAILAAELRQLSKRIKGRFKGLLEIEFPNEEPLAAEDHIFRAGVRLLHTSVQEILNSRSSTSKYAGSVDCQEIFQCLATAYLSYIDSVNKGSMSCFRMVSGYDLGEGYHNYNFQGTIWMVELAALIRFGITNMDDDLRSEQIVYFAKEVDNRLGTKNGRIEPGSYPILHDAPRYFDLDLLMVSTLFYEYFETKYAPDSKSMHGKSVFLLISLGPMIWRHSASVWGKMDSFNRYFRTLRALFQRGLGPNLRYDGYTAGFDGQNIFSDCLSFLFLQTYSSGRNEKYIKDPSTAFGTSMQYWTELFKCCIEHGADTYYWFQFYPLSFEEAYDTVLVLNNAGSESAEASNGVHTRRLTPIALRSYQMTDSDPIADMVCSRDNFEGAKTVHRLFLIDLINDAKLRLLPATIEVLRKSKEAAQRMPEESRTVVAVEAFDNICYNGRWMLHSMRLTCTKGNCCDKHGFGSIS
jgi:NACHT domain